MIVEDESALKDFLVKIWPSWRYADLLRGRINFGLGHMAWAGEAD